MLSHTEQLLFFQHLPGTTTSTYWRILDKLPALHSIFDIDLSLIADILKPEARALVQKHRTLGLNCPTMEKVKRDIAWAEANHVHLIDSDHDAYPELLRDIKKAPPLLYVKGETTNLSLPQIAMVGSRSASPTGILNAKSFAKELAHNGFCITSGLALGIDTAAHQGAMQTNGRTIAVLGTGIDTIYPQRNTALAHAIVEQGGTIVTEFPLGTPPLPPHFPQRNRIISGLSYGTLVIEAALKSGSLITARYATEQNREVFALPSSIHNPLNKGCHTLIKQGAKLVETSNDIVQELGNFLQYQWEHVTKSIHASRATTDSNANAPTTPEPNKAIYQEIGYESTSVDMLVERTHLPISEIMTSLLNMEIEGIIANSGIGYVRL